MAASIVWCFFFNDTATTEIYTLSLHDALPILFADIAGFTGLSERLGDQIIPLLSGYLDTVSREISGHGGTIDKFIGDAVMAFWGAPAVNPDHAVDACRAAL